AGLAALTNYAIRIDDTAITDIVGNPFAGIADDTTWTFTTMAQVQTRDFSTTELAYAGDVSYSDLLTGLTATTNDMWKPDGGATVAALNDGIHGGTAPPVQGAYGAIGATAEYHLGPGANNFGYDITSIQSIAAWPGAGRGNQAYTVEVKLKGAASYTPLATVDYEPLPLGLEDQGATKVTLTDNSGVLASGVEYIRFTVNIVNGGAYDGLYVMREIDVIGVPTAGVDNIPPTIVTLNPTDNATGVVAGSTDLVATFTEYIALGTGNITIMNLDTLALTEIPVGDPPAGLAALTNYAIRIDDTAITDIVGNPFAGIADDTTWTFTTMAQVQTRVFSTTELAYAGDVSNSDLLNGLTATATTGTWLPNGGASLAQLNDGIHGRTHADAGSVEGANGAVGAAAEYHLGLGANSLGYDLTSIQSIAAWGGAGRGNQAYTVEVKLIGATDYTPLATVDYEPLGLGLTDQGATKVTLTDNGGILASGVEYIRFTVNMVNGGAYDGNFIMREIDVFGGPTGGASAPYGTWASTHGLTGTAGDGSGTDPAFDADPNKDGVANGLVWLIGGTTGDPLANNNTILPVPTADGAKLVLSFQCLKSSARGTANLYVQYGTDLGAGWQGVSVPDSDQADGGSGVGFVVAPILGSDYNHVTATIAAPVSGGRLFGRLMATE
ncbi:MAG: Ig-like domain-containing protein, partial [Verrucomicrobia bacterium]|nr:Ig-like domain-containing protein [Verrucomicrobiota bacterium]